MQATYYGVFDGHASHTVSLIVSKLLHMIVKVCYLCILGCGVGMGDSSRLIRRNLRKEMSKP